MRIGALIAGGIFAADMIYNVGVAVRAYKANKEYDRILKTLKNINFMRRQEDDYVDGLEVVYTQKES